LIKVATPVAGSISLIFTATSIVSVPTVQLFEEHYPDKQLLVVVVPVALTGLMKSYENIIT